MTAHQRVSVMLPFELVVEVRRFASKNNLGVDDVIEKALDAYLPVPGDV